MSNIVVKEESTGEVLLEAYELAKAHYYEVEEKSDTMPFSLDVSMMSICLDAGMLSIVTARADGVLVGYFANMISPDIMTSQLVGKELGIYLDKKFRGSSTFIKMLRLTEKVAKERGATSQLLAFKSGHDTGLAERVGYKPTETLYQKIIGE